jgi:hypothetical protein
MLRRPIEPTVLSVTFREKGVHVAYVPASSVAAASSAAHFTMRARGGERSTTTGRDGAPAGARRAGERQPGLVRPHHVAQGEHVLAWPFSRANTRPLAPAGLATSSTSSS